jgi:hypothetical protein
MNGLAALFAGGRIIDLIIAGVCVEAAALLLYRRRTGRGPTGAQLLPNLMAGTCLLLAVRGALAGAWWGWTALPLAGSLAFHLLDLRQRWPRHGAGFERASGPGRMP